MPTDRCPDVEELEVLLKLPSHDSRRRHLDDCPRCRARVMTFLEFTAAPDDVPRDLLHEAEAKLDAALKRELALGGDRRSEAGAAPFRRWLASLSQPRFAFTAGAAVLAVAVFVAVKVVSRRPNEPFLLRGSEEHVAPGTSTSLALRAAPAEGGMELTWSSVPGADAYEVRIYATNLEEIARLRPTPEARRLLARSDLPPSVAAGSVVLWKVVALQGGDPLQESAPTPLRVP